MNEIKQFKTESKQLLDLMIHSIYTNKEIFLRELISNASDACDKYHYLALANDTLDKGREFKILITLDKANRTLQIQDNGIGMTKDELDDALGTIAKSGSKEFLKKVAEEKAKNADGKEPSADAPEIIGQFGVGFYSAFMVAKKVVVLSKSPLDPAAHSFTSSGEDTYEIADATMPEEGTIITLFLRDDAEGEDYSTYLDTYTIERLVKKYSDYVRYPIQMMVEKHVPQKDADGKEIEGKYDDVNELETLNSMTPLWRKAKKDITEEELSSFYKSKYADWHEPLASLHFTVEGAVNYTALLFIPSEMPYDLYSEKYEKGLQLYTKGVFIMDKCKELLPDYLRFVRGLVDTADLPLNISRETFQSNRSLKAIAENVEKKIIAKLVEMKEKEPEKYETFFKSFGATIKYGIYQDYGASKEKLQDLLIFATAETEKKESLAEYVASMKVDQKDIYYAASATREAALAMPQMDLLKKKGYDVLVLTEDVDEFCLSVMGSYKDHKFKSVNQGDLDVATPEEKKALQDATASHQTLLSALKTALGDKVKEVRLSSRLTDSPVCLVAEDGVSFSMEKIVSHVPGNKGVAAGRILELNPHHPLFARLEDLSGSQNPLLPSYAELLYDEALLIEGLPVEDPVRFASLMTTLMTNDASASAKEEPCPCKKDEPCEGECTCKKDEPCEGECTCKKEESCDEKDGTNADEDSDKQSTK